MPGKLGEVRISLFPFTKKILSLLQPTFEKLGMQYDIFGLHWRGGENDTIKGPPNVVIPTVKPIYRQMFDMFTKSLGRMPDTVLTCPACKLSLPPTTPFGYRIHGMRLFYQTGSGGRKTF